MGFRKQLIDEFLKTKAEFLTAHHSHKTELKRKVERLKADIASFTGHKALPGFDWTVEFAEVFINGGFDVVIANPPYRKERESKELIAALQTSPRWKQWYEGKSDLWYLFLHQAFDICKTGGLIHFITSRYWIAGQGAKKLVDRIRLEASVRVICDLGKVKVFEEVSGQHMTAMYEKGHRRQPLIIKRIRTDDRGVAFESIPSHETTDAILVLRYPNDEVLFNANGGIDLTPDISDRGGLEIFERGVVPLSHYFEVRQGIAQNPDRISRKVAKEFDGEFAKGEGVFVVSPTELSQLGLSTSERKFVRPFYEDYQIHRFACDKVNDYWLLYLTTHNAPDISPYPNLRKHLARFRRLMGRRRETENGSNKWFHLHWPREERLFEGPKIVALQMASRPTFAFNDSSCYFGFGCNVIKTELPDDVLFAILGILNSRVASPWFTKHAKQRGIGLDIGGTVLQEFPIPMNILGNAAELAAVARKFYERIQARKKSLQTSSRSLKTPLSVPMAMQAPSPAHVGTV